MIKNIKDISVTMDEFIEKDKKRRKEFSDTMAIASVFLLVFLLLIIALAINHHIIVASSCVPDEFLLKLIK